MDHETDFLTPEFLDLTLFAQRNVVIYPFVLAQKLTHLTAVLSAFYAVQTVDLTNLSTPESVDLFFSMHQEQNTTLGDGKQSLLIFPNGIKANLSTLTKYPAVRFIGIETEIAPELCSAEITLYNKKTRQFEQWDRKAVAGEKYASDVQNWCQFIIEQLTPLLSEPSETISQHCDLVAFWSAAQELYRAIAEDHLDRASTLRSQFEDLEFHALGRFTAAYFHLNLPEIPVLPATSTSPSPPSSPNTPPAEFLHEMIAIKTASETIYVAFETMLKTIPIPESTTAFSPEAKYAFLRGNNWAHGIPLTAMYDLFRGYLQERLKQVKLTAAGFEKFVQKEHKTLLDAFAEVPFDPHFKVKTSLPVKTWLADPVLTAWFIAGGDMLPKNAFQAKSPKTVSPSNDVPLVDLPFDSASDWILEAQYRQKLADIHARLDANPLDYHALLDREFERVMAQARQSKK